MKPFQWITFVMLLLEKTDKCQLCDQMSSIAVVLDVSNAVTNKVLAAEYLLMSSIYKKFQSNFIRSSLMTYLGGKTQCTVESRFTNGEYLHEKDGYLSITKQQEIEIKFKRLQNYTESKSKKFDVGCCDQLLSDLSQRIEGERKIAINMIYSDSLISKAVNKDEKYIIVNVTIETKNNKVLQLSYNDTEYKGWSDIKRIKLVDFLFKFICKKDTSKRSTSLTASIAMSSTITTPLVPDFIACDIETSLAILFDTSINTPLKGVISQYFIITELLQYFLPMSITASILTYPGGNTECAVESRLTDGSYIHEKDGFLNTYINDNIEIHLDNLMKYPPENPFFYNNECSESILNDLRNKTVGNKNFGMKFLYSQDGAQQKNIFVYVYTETKRPFVFNVTEDPNEPTGLRPRELKILVKDLLKVVLCKKEMSTTSYGVRGTTFLPSSYTSFRNASTKFVPSGFYVATSIISSPLLLATPATSNTWTTPVSITPSKTESYKSSSAVGRVREVEDAIKNFTNREFTDEQLSNVTWGSNFLQTFADIFSKTASTGGVSEEAETRLFGFAEETLLKVGNKIALGTTIKINKSTLIAEVTALDMTTAMTDYVFPPNSNNGGSFFTLPKNLLQSRKAGQTNNSLILVSMKYKTTRSMKKNGDSFVANDDTLSITIDPPPLSPFDHPLQYIMTIREITTNVKCVFWNTSLKVWDQSGCKLASWNTTHAQCHCTHMTSFSILMKVNAHKIPSGHQFALSIITYVGSSVSIAACLTLILLYFSLGLIKIQRNLIHANLAAAIGVSNILFISANFGIKYKNVCLGISAAMLFFYLSSFFWMLVEGIHVYFMIVKVFKQKRKFLLYIMIGWLLPAIITTSVTSNYTELMTTSEFCWMSTEKGVIWAFIGPTLLIIGVNLVILIKTILVAKHSFGIKGDDDISEGKRIAKLTILLMPIFGISWIFGVFAINKELIVFEYIFTVVNVLQGVFIFIGYAVFNNEVKTATADWSRRSSYYSKSNTFKNNSTKETQKDIGLRNSGFSGSDDLQKTTIHREGSATKVWSF